MAQFEERKNETFEGWIERNTQPIPPLQGIFFLRKGVKKLLA
jgi:hypothetical protein